MVGTAQAPLPALRLCILVRSHQRANRGLIGYGVNFSEMFRRAATFVDKILKGEKPGIIPVEQATQFKTVLNFKTANALALHVPALILVRADQVIE